MLAATNENQMLIVYECHTESYRRISMTRRHGKGTTGLGIWIPQDGELYPRRLQAQWIVSIFTRRDQSYIFPIAVRPMGLVPVFK